MAIDTAWVKTNEEHHTAGFWLKLRSFVNLAFQKPLLQLSTDSIIFQQLLKVCLLILSQVKYVYNVYYVMSYTVIVFFDIYV